MEKNAPDSTHQTVGTTITHRTAARNNSARSVTLKPKPKGDGGGSGKGTPRGGKGGDKGGNLLFQGTPENFLKSNIKSYTKEHLSKCLR